MGVLLSLRENNDLIEVKIIEKLDKLADLLGFFKLYEVLLQSMKGEFRFLVDEKLLGIFHIHSTYILGLG